MDNIPGEHRKNAAILPLWHCLPVKLGGYAALLGLMLGMLLSLVQIASDFQHERATINAGIEQLISSLQETAAEAAYQVDKDRGNSVLSGLFVFPAVYHGAIIDDFGDILVEKTRGEKPEEPGVITRFLVGTDPHREVVLRVAQRLNPVGRMKVWLNLNLLARNFTSRLGVTAITGIFWSLGLAALMAFMFYLMIAKPLVASVRQIQNRKYGDSVQEIVDIPAAHAKNELGLLLTSINLFFKDSEKAQDALHESEERFKDFAETTSDWFWEMDADLRFSYFSGQFPKITGVTPSTLLGKTREETGIPNVDPGVWANHLADLNAHREFSDFVHPRTDPNGQTVWLSISGKPVFDGTGVFKGYRGTGTDITQRKQSETALAVAKEDAEQANKAKSEFLAAMSHDLRTPLNAIMGFADMMRTKAFGSLGDPHYEEYADDIHESGALLVSLINDVLDLSKIEAGKYELVEEPLDVLSLIQSSIRQLANMAKGSHQTLSADVPLDMPHILGDERALIQIFNNLLSNAIKFTPDGGKIGVTSNVGEDNGIVLSVSDTGLGMSEEGIERALKPFEQADGTHSRRHEGTGLGLHLCVNFMQLFGGTLGIESEVGKGTTIILRFPPERTLLQTPTMSA